MESRYRQAVREAGRPQHLKPKLTVDEQIAHLRSKGISFDLISEDEGRLFLSRIDEFYDLMAYRRLYEKYDAGDRAGQYINLDFAHLIDLAEINKQLLNTLMLVALDIEQSTKMAIIDRVSADSTEDGYSIVLDYLGTRHDRKRGYIQHEIERSEHNPFYRDMLQKYHDDMPVWVFIQITSFGTLIDLYSFCASRWSDAAMKERFYHLKSVKAIRNAAAHNTNLISTFRERDARLTSDPALGERLKRTGISRNSRRLKMRNIAIQQIVETLYVYSSILPDCISPDATVKSLRELSERLRKSEYYRSNNTIQSSFDFLAKIIDSWI